MDNRTRFAVFFVLFILCGALFTAPAFANERQAYIVQFQDAYKGKTENAKVLLRNQLTSLAKSLGTDSVPEFTNTFDHVISGAVMELTESEAKHLTRLDLIKHIEKDSLVYPAQGWGLDRVNQRDLPLDHDWTMTYDGTGATIFVVDTGINVSHDEFDAFFGTRVTEAAFVSGISGGGDDCQGHGTHVASIAAGGNVGVASGSSIYSIRISDNCATGEATNSQVIDAFDQVMYRVTQDTQMYPKIENAVVNFSYEDVNSSAVESSMDSLVREGVVVVTAAGNDDEDACTESKPRSALIVGATTDSDSRWSDSNYGSCINIMAPGESVEGARHDDDDGYVAFNGTSMASPYIAGIAAAYLDQFPGADNYEVMEAILEGASQGKLSNLSGSPNLLGYTEIGAPESYWQMGGTIQSPANVPRFPDPGCDRGDTTFTTVNQAYGIAVQWHCQ